MSTLCFALAPIASRAEPRDPADAPLTAKRVDSPATMGDMRATTAALYREHRVAIARQIRALVQEDAAVDDLVAETFLRAHRSIGSFDGRSAVGTWLHGIAINVARTHLSKRVRRRDIDARRVDTEPPGPTPPDEELSARRALERFREAVRDLPDALREAFVLRVIEQRSWQDAAVLLQVPISTLYGRVAKAEAQVRAAVSGGDDV
ncbi:MAG: RNA polymerase sigma factor [Deltaproteobacteria bacterium]|nr:RNA polymerase sigma factor [Deltaproteobacteria bacterium]